MEKISISELQCELREWLRKIGLSHNEFAALYILEFDDNCSDDDIKKFQEKFKKQISRKTTKHEILVNYLNFLPATMKFKEFGYFRPQCHTEDILSDEIKKAFHKISKVLTDTIIKNDKFPNDEI